MATAATNLPRLPPGPALNPLAAWRAVYRPTDNYSSLRRRFGDIVTVAAPHVTIVMTMSAAGARQVLSAEHGRYDAYYKGPFTRLVGPGSLWVLDGPRHRHERRMLQPAVDVRRVREHGQLIVDLTHAQTEHWHVGQRISAYEAMLGIGRDVILQLVFGIQRDTDLREGRRVLARLLDAAKPEFSYLPQFQTRWYPRWRRFRRAMQDFSRFAATCQQTRGDSPDDNDDVLGLMMRAQRDDPAAMSDEAIRDELATLLLSGHETTAVGLSWALYELARHPGALDRLRESLSALGLEPDPAVTAQDPYLAAVCSETLRLHTILTEVARVTRVPLDVLGYRLPAGINVGVAICAIHGDPDLYPEPDRFLPERFLERSYSPHEFLPFGGGHRRCLGAALANYQMRLVLATIVREWRLEPTRDDRDARHNIGMGPKHGVPMRVMGRLGT